MDSTSRNLVLALLVIAIAVAVIYMIDPTFFGLMKKSDGFEAITNTKPAQSDSGAVAGQNAQSGDSITRAIELAMAEAQSQLSAGTPGNVSPFANPAKRTEGFTNPPKRTQGFQDAGAMPTMPTMPTAPTMPTTTMPTTNTPMGVASAPSGAEGFADYEGATADLNNAGPANCYPKNQLAPQELLPLDQNSTWAQANPSAQGSIAGKNFLSAGSLIGVNTVGQSLRNANQQLRAEPPCPQMKVSIWNESTIEPDLGRRPLE